MEIGTIVINKHGYIGQIKRIEDGMLYFTDDKHGLAWAFKPFTRIQSVKDMKRLAKAIGV